MYESRRFLEKGCLDLLPFRAWGAFSGGDELWEPRHGGYEPALHRVCAPTLSRICGQVFCKKMQEILG